MIGIALRLARRFAPDLVGGLLGDRAGSIAEQVFSLGNEIFGEDLTPDQLAQRLENDAERAHRFSMRMADIELEEARVAAQDRDSARQRELSLAQLGESRLVMKVLALAAMGLFIVVTLMLFFVTVPEGPQRDLLLMLFGALLLLVKDVYGYFFGSSEGSARKQGQIDRILGGE